MIFATHLVRTQFVLSVYKRRHHFAVNPSSGYITIEITARFSLWKRKLFDFQYENWFEASYGCQYLAVYAATVCCIDIGIDCPIISMVRFPIS